jgi:hypothetical protein
MKLMRLAGQGRREEARRQGKMLWRAEDLRSLRKGSQDARPVEPPAFPGHDLSLEPRGRK